MDLHVRAAVRLCYVCHQLSLCTGPVPDLPMCIYGVCATLELQRHQHLVLQHKGMGKLCMYVTTGPIQAIL